MLTIIIKSILEFSLIVLLVFGFIFEYKLIDFEKKFINYIKKIIKIKF